jgi:Thrombospondin type 3 repeat
MKGRNLRVALAALAIGITGLAMAGSASAATSLYHPDEKSRKMWGGTPSGSSGWTSSSSYQNGVCVAPVTCPAVLHSFLLKGSAPGGGIDTQLMTRMSGVASLGVTAVSTWTGPSFTYNGAAGEQPDSVSFVLDRAANVSNLLSVGGSADWSFVLDDLTTGTSLSVVDQAPANSNTNGTLTIPAVSIDPSQLTIGNSYQMRIISRAAVPTAAVLQLITFNYDNVVVTATAADTDEDGVLDRDDNCLDVANPDQANLDGDQLGDACDTDIDGDGLPNDQENADGCPAGPSPTNADSDGDGAGDAQDAFPCDANESNDADNDGVGDNGDNCPTVANADQADTDGDGIGNVCDATPNGDTDNDGVDNNSDNCPSAANPSQSDTDGDGQGDACDPTPNGDTDNDGIDNNADNCPTVSNADQADLDNDHIGDACDNDIDGDGVPNGSDPEPLNPNVPAAGARGAGGAQGAFATGDRVRVKVKCPRNATAKRCKVKVVGRAAKKGPRVTNVIRTRVKRGKRKVITLTIQQPFLTQAQANGRVLVVRKVRKGAQKPKRRLLSRPIVNA